MTGLLLALALRQDPSVAEGLKVSPWATGPQVQNPVALSIDERGRVYVAESHRRPISVLDLKEWYREDLACRTLADREALIRRRLAGKTGGESDRVRLLEDTDADGRADKAAVFAEGFNGLVDGPAGGVLAGRGGDVYFASIPNLWLLKDNDNDGKADYRIPVHAGFGVRFSLPGHDLRGPTLGPDGRLYFAVGDRGFDVLTREKRKLEYLDTGAVLRCNPDGTDLEVFAYGLRNPQDLAFDATGNLWTVDGAAGTGDEARWVCVLEGGDGGWRSGWQFASDWGEPPPGQLPAPGRDSPWMTEALWKGRAPYQIPPAGFTAAAPAGLAFHPGTGLHDRYRDRLLLCASSGIEAFAAKPKGASYEIGDPQPLLSGGKPTDAAFGPDGALYVADREKGVLRVTGAEAPETRTLLTQGLRRKPTEELGKLLGHPDQRVRFAAQLALAPREGSSQIMGDIAAKAELPLPARLHAIWGLGTLFTRGPVIRLLKDPEPEIRAQAARALGDRRIDQGFEALLPLLKDPSPRVRFFAAIAVGKIGRVEAVVPIVQMLRENADRDAALRHAGVHALAWIGSMDALLKQAKDPSPAVRMAVLLAFRRLGRLDVVRYLQDPEPALVFEAARAINDSPIVEGLPELAALLDRPDCPAPALLRAINANFRAGTPERLVRFARRADAPAALRAEALRALGAWAKPGARDRVTGLWRPLPERDPAPAREALRPALAELLAALPVEAAEAGARLGLRK